MNVGIKTYFIIEKVYGVSIELQRKSLEEGYIIRHHLLIAEVKFMDNDGVNMVVGEQVIWKGKK